MHWDDNKFSILTWEERYTFILNRKGKCKDILCKSLISKEQALEVVNRLNLIHVKDLTFRSAGTCHSNMGFKTRAISICF